MLDFTSSLYLGMQHDSQSLQPWQQLTTGRPAAIANPKSHSRLAKEIALLQGLEDGAIAKSTLHLFWDLFDMFSQGGFVAFVDSEAYPIAQWGLERLASKGNDVIKFRHHHPGNLRQVLRSRLENGLRPLVVADGWCTHCGELAPLREYLDCVRNYDGFLIVDDTQALGVLGKHPRHNPPYGLKGGGSLQYLDIDGADIILVSSLAKGFGVPIAVISGSYQMIAKFKELSETRVHCSPPSQADVNAAEYALHLNQEMGDRLRHKLGQLVRMFKKSLFEIGFKTQGSIFPVQKLLLPLKVNIESFYFRLDQIGVRSILTHNGRNTQEPKILFALNTTHNFEDFYLLSEIIQRLMVGSD